MQELRELPERDGLSGFAQQIRALSIDKWGEKGAVEIVGRSPSMTAVLERLAKIAAFDEPVLVLGESGVGKELLAKAIYLLGPRSAHQLVAVNCPQYQEGNLTVSELFGHVKGSFTGAVSDRRGCFETAGRGVIFLDEIADLHMSAQVMLLRALANNEFQPLGSNVTRSGEARVVAATNRSLNALAEEKQFRKELIFRLRYFLVEVPALRDREDDWLVLIDHFLEKLYLHYGVRKRFSQGSLRLLEQYSWPGNVRELETIVTSGYALSDSEVIEPDVFVDRLESGAEEQHSPLRTIVSQLRDGDGCFWELVRDPFLARDLNRAEVRSIVQQGLRSAGGSYRRLLDEWRLPEDDYQRFMDFLRHHRLKPSGETGPRWS